MNADSRLVESGFTLPPAPSAVGIYKPALTIGSICYTSGHLPMMPDGSFLTGCVGAEIDVEAGHAAARQSGLSMLSTLTAHLGTLNKVKRVIKLFGMVYCTSDFTQQPAILNGCSELMAQIFGDETGIGTRSAVGVASLPLGVIVEIEGIFELND